MEGKRKDNIYYIYKINIFFPFTFHFLCIDYELKRLKLPEDKYRILE